MRKVKIAAVVIVLLTAVYFVLSFANRMTGTVVDAETGKPIEGAVVLVEWTRTKGLGLTYTTSYKVKEIVTDKNGQFTVNAVPNPFVNPPDITIYNKGYVAWSSRWIFPGMLKRTDFKWGTFEFRLQHFKPEYSFADHTMFIGQAIHDNLGIINKTLIINSTRWENEKASHERDK